MCCLCLAFASQNNCFRRVLLFYMIVQCYGIMVSPLDYNGISWEGLGKPISTFFCILLEIRKNQLRYKHPQKFKLNYNNSLSSHDASGRVNQQESIPVKPTKTLRNPNRWPKYINPPSTKKLKWFPITIIITFCNLNSK